MTPEEKLKLETTEIPDIQARRVTAFRELNEAGKQWESLPGNSVEVIGQQLDNLRTKKLAFENLFASTEEAFYWMQSNDDDIAEFQPEEEGEEHGI